MLAGSLQFMYLKKENNDDKQVKFKLFRKHRCPIIHGEVSYDHTKESWGGLLMNHSEDYVYDVVLTLQGPT